MNECYKMIRMGVAGHVRGNRTETMNNEYANAGTSKLSPVTLRKQRLLSSIKLESY